MTYCSYEIQSNFSACVANGSIRASTYHGPTDELPMNSPGPLADPGVPFRVLCSAAWLHQSTGWVIPGRLLPFPHLVGRVEPEIASLRVALGRGGCLLPADYSVGSHLCARSPVKSRRWCRQRTSERLSQIQSARVSYFLTFFTLSYWFHRTTVNCLFIKMSRRVRELLPVVAEKYISNDLVSSWRQNSLRFFPLIRQSSR